MNPCCEDIQFDAECPCLVTYPIDEDTQTFQLDKFEGDLQLDIEGSIPFECCNGNTTTVIEKIDNLPNFITIVETSIGTSGNYEYSLNFNSSTAVTGVYTAIVTFKICNEYLVTQRLIFNVIDTCVNNINIPSTPIIYNIDRIEDDGDCGIVNVNFDFECCNDSAFFTIVDYNTLPLSTGLNIAYPPKGTVITNQTFNLPWCFNGNTSPLSTHDVDFKLNFCGTYNFIQKIRFNIIQNCEVELPELTTSTININVYNGPVSGSVIDDITHVCCGLNPPITITPISISSNPSLTVSTPTIAGSNLVFNYNYTACSTIGGFGSYTYRLTFCNNLTIDKTYHINLNNVCSTQLVTVPPFSETELFFTYQDPKIETINNVLATYNFNTNNCCIPSCTPHKKIEYLGYDILDANGNVPLNPFTVLTTGELTINDSLLYSPSLNGGLNDTLTLTYLGITPVLAQTLKIRLNFSQCNGASNFSRIFKIIVESPVVDLTAGIIDNHKSFINPLGDNTTNTTDGFTNLATTFKNTVFNTQVFLNYASDGIGQDVPNPGITQGNKFLQAKLLQSHNTQCPTNVFYTGNPGDPFIIAIIGYTRGALALPNTSLSLVSYTINTNYNPNLVNFKIAVLITDASTNQVVYISNRNNLKRSWHGNSAGESAKPNLLRPQNTIKLNGIDYNYDFIDGSRAIVIPGNASNSIQNAGTFKIYLCIDRKNFNESFPISSGIAVPYIALIPWSTPNNVIGNDASLTFDENTFISSTPNGFTAYGYDQTAHTNKRVYYYTRIFEFTSDGTAIFDFTPTGMFAISATKLVPDGVDYDNPDHYFSSGTGGETFNQLTGPPGQNAYPRNSRHGLLWHLVNYSTTNWDRFTSNGAWVSPSGNIYSGSNPLHIATMGCGNFQQTVAAPNAVFQGVMSVTAGDRIMVIIHRGLTPPNESDLKTSPFFGGDPGFNQFTLTIIHDDGI
jgi:hypothetical protein